MLFRNVLLATSFVLSVSVCPSLLADSFKVIDSTEVMIESNNGSVKSLHGASKMESKHSTQNVASYSNINSQATNKTSNRSSYSSGSASVSSSKSNSQSGFSSNSSAVSASKKANIHSYSQGSESFNSKEIFSESGSSE